MRETALIMEKCVEKYGVCHDKLSGGEEFGEGFILLEGA